MDLKGVNAMYENTLTDLLIRRGLIPPMQSSCALDESDAPALPLDGKENAQNAEKDRD